jgi:hypothetical protein
MQENWTPRKRNKRKQPTRSYCTFLNIVSGFVKHATRVATSPYSYFQFEKSTNCRKSAAAYSIYSQLYSPLRPINVRRTKRNQSNITRKKLRINELPPALDAVPPTFNLRTRHAMTYLNVTECLNSPACLSPYLEPYASATLLC